VVHVFVYTDGVNGHRWLCGTDGYTIAAFDIAALDLESLHPWRVYNGADG
jgi:hypothetical protein